MQVKRAGLILSFIAGITALTVATVACASDSAPAVQPAADKAALEQQAMEAKAAAEKIAMEKTAMEEKAMAEKTAMEKKAMEDKAMMEKLPDQQFAAHFVDSNPAHGVKLSQVPAAVSVSFNFTLSDASTITVTKDGKQVNSGKPTFTSNKLTMTTLVPSGAGTGTYVVDYSAWWPDNSYHNGKFAFTVNP